MELAHSTMIMSLLISISLFLIVFFWGVRRQQKKQKMMQGIIWLQALRSMLMHIQRHRALSTAVLAGDKTLLAELESAQRSISRDLGHTASVGYWIQGNPEWQAITAHWARLSGRYQQLNINQNLDQHTKLIGSVLAFIDDVAIMLNLQTPAQENALQAQTSWRYLLHLTEALGQLRAIGLAYIASLERGENMPRLRNTLSARVAQCISSTEQPDFDRFISSAQKTQILQFIERFPNALLHDPQTCPVKNYYQSATGVMDALYLQFDRELQTIQGAL